MRTSLRPIVPVFLLAVAAACSGSGGGGGPGGPDGGEPTPDATPDVTPDATPDATPDHDLSGAPELTRIGNRSVEVDATFRLLLEATDPDGDTLIFSVIGDLPEGAKFDKAARRFSWTPAQAQLGLSVFLTFQVSDGSLSDSETVIFEVVASGSNAAPRFRPISDQTLIAEEAFEMTLRAEDPDGDTLRFSAVGPGLPGGASLDADTGVFRWQPRADQRGAVFLVLFQVTDGKLSDDAEVRLAVEATMTPPSVLPIADRVAQVGEAIEIRIRTSDPDGDAVTVRPRGELPEGASFDDSVPALRWTPTAEQAGRNFRLSFEVSDGTFFVIVEARVLVEAPPDTGCVADMFEPNDSQDAATPVQARMYDGLTLCAGEVDLFFIDVPDGEALIAQIDFSHAQGDLDMGLFSEAGESIGFAESRDDDETLETGALRGGTYLLFIAGPPDASVDYALTLSFAEVMGPMCVEDALEGPEGNENDDADGAAPLQPGVTTDLMLCPRDFDVYAVEAEAGQSMTVSLSFDDAAVDFDVAIFEAAQGTELAISAGVASPERVRVDSLPVTGRYLVLVFGFEQDSGAYSLEIELGEGVVRPPCEADENEPNDGREAATALLGEAGPDSFDSLSICEGDVDWFAFPVAAGEQLTAFVTFEHLRGDLDLRLHGPGPDGPLVAEANSEDDDEFLEAGPIEAAGTYYLEVLPYLRAANDYALIVELSAP